MIPKSAAHKYYHSATQRFLKPALKEFFKREFPHFFGPIIRENVAEQILILVNNLNATKDALNPGQILWYALDKNTRADNPNRKLKPLILTIISQDDCQKLAKGAKMSQIRPHAIARIMKEAYQQGALLSMRDIEILTWHSKGALHHSRIKYEEEFQEILPHTGTLHDMGSCISHKTVIVKKILIDKKETRTVAAETNHSLKAVEHYYKNFRRVEQLYQKNQDPQYIAMVTAIAKHVVLEYIDIIKALK
mgnify:CR=1 FL=1